METKCGIIYLTVKVWLEKDLDAEEINEVVWDLDYEINHDLITRTEIMEVESPLHNN